MRKSLHALFRTICALLLIPSSVMATDYTIETIPAPATPKLAVGIPLTISTSSASSITQQVYLASELLALDASAGDITGIKLYYGGKTNNTAVPSVTRSLKIYMTEIATDSLKLDTISGDLTRYRFSFKSAGTYVFNGTITTEALSAGEIKTLSITFNQSSYPWDGTKNILLTVFDLTNTNYSSSEANLRFVYMPTEHPRFVHQYWPEDADHEASEYLPPATSLAGLEGYSATSGSDGTQQQKQIRGHLLVPKISFTITPSAAPTIPSTPEDLAASNVGSTSASLTWSAVDGATSYDLYNSTSIDGVYSKFASSATNSYDWSGLTASTTYFVKVAAVNEAGSSDLSEPISFTTLAPHIHDGITFEPWSNPSAMPTSGNYYLATDVAFGWESSDVTLTGDLNLCLNGHEANLAFFKIVVPDDKTLAIYDNVGGGKIASFVASEVGAFDIYAKALIVVYNGAELDLHQGTIENTYIPDEDGQSYAIYSNGTLHLSGDVLINSNDADIYLHESRVITLDGALTNAEKHTIYKNDGAITSGWSTYMSAADPRDYLESVNSAKSIYFNGTEAALQTLLTLSETSLNSAINSNDGQIVDVNLTRPLVASQYNTLCLPFALTADQMEEYFGAGYELWELESSSLDGEQLSLAFERKYALEAGKPYLLQPADDVSSVMFFDDVTIVKTLSNTETEYVDFHGTFGPTELEGGNRNLLFLGADNELLWPATTANIKGFRAYFEVKGGAQGAKRARIVKKEDAATGMDQITNDKLPMTNKILRNGQLLILRDNKTYNVLGMEYGK